MPSKRASRSAPPNLRAFVEQLRHAATVLESDLPLLDASKMTEAIRRLQKDLAALLSGAAASLAVPRADYQKLRHDWLEAWSLEPATMSDAVARALPEKLPQHPAGEEDTLWRLRVLVQCLRVLGTESTAALVQQILRAPVPTPEPRDFGMKIDREANAAVQSWGRLPLDTFLAEWKRLDVDLLQRACNVLGFPQAKRWTRPQQTEFHRRAQRFARNTAV